MSVKHTSRTTEVIAALNRAAAAAGTAGAEILAEALRKKLEAGYTSGAFVTGRVAGEVVVKPADGNNVARVILDDPVAAAWELGHYNIFTRQYERVEHIRNTTIEQIAKVRSAIISRMRNIR